VEAFQASGIEEEGEEEGEEEEGPPKRKVTVVGESRVRDPEPLIPGTHTPNGVEKSKLLSLEEARCVAAGIPGRKKLCNWNLLYCSEAHGFSLQTMYRAGASSHYSVLLVEDFSGFVFGAYCTDALKVSPRYQGNGECFVFQVRPNRVKYDWHQLQGGARNDFYMMVSPDSLGFGGEPHFAIWLDSDLLYGNSGLCHTFSSPMLSGTEDFKVKSVELWGIQM
jgi:TLD